MERETHRVSLRESYGYNKRQRENARVGEERKRDTE